MSTQSSDEKLIAVLQSAKAPTDKQRSRLLAFLKRTYGQEPELTWQQDDSLEKGFRLKAGSDVYDWSLEGRMRQFQERMQQLEPGQENIVPLMRQAIENWTPAAQAEEVGQVLTVGDEIATVSGLERAEYGEILVFSNGVKGMVQDLRRDCVGCILFGGSEDIAQGSIVRRTGKTAGMPVAEGYLGRVVDALGVPEDGKGDITPDQYRPIEAAAPGILDRQPVNTPMETGLLAIDAALADVRRGKTGVIPRELQNVHADSAGQEREQGYLYPHNFSNHWVPQQYLPDLLKGTVYYHYGDNKVEQAARHYWDAIKGGSDGNSGR